MLEVALRHRFGNFQLEAEFTAAGEGITALFGPSGCGKSTTLAAIAGLLKPQQGRVALDGRVLFDSTRRINLPPEERRCGVVFQDARLFPHLSVETNLRFGLRRAPLKAAGPSFAEVVTLLDLKPLLERRPGGLSGGEKQRVALGRALLARPRLLLMDEPLAALDAGRRAEVLPFLARLRDASRLPILYVTHALEEVDALADRLVLLHHGRVVAQDTPEALALRTDLPLAGRRDAGAVLECTVITHEPARGLTVLAFPGSLLVMPLRSEPVGSRARLRIRARDVAVATAEPKGLSTQNVLEAHVLGFGEPPSPHEVFVRLGVGPSELLARLTRDSASRLRLTPGMQVWAVVKAVTFDHSGLTILP